MASRRLVRRLRAVLVACAVAAVLPAGAGLDAQSRSRTAENVVQGVRRNYERRPAEWRRQTAVCLHYLDEAEAFHNEGEAYFQAASRARSTREQSPLVRLGNEAIAERQRLIQEFWACTRRMTDGDVFDSSRRPPREPTPPGPGAPPPEDVPPPPGPGGPPARPAPPAPPPWPGLPPGFPLPPVEARPPRGPADPPRAPVPVIVALGDSITAGSGLRPGERAYPEVLQARLTREGYRYHVFNAGLHNDTSAGARRRLAQVLAQNRHAQILVVEIGANDFRSVRPIGEIRGHIGAILDEARTRGLRVLLAGFVMREMGVPYESEFNAMYPALASSRRVALLPDLMSIVWGDAGRLTSDGFHPNATGAHMIGSQVFRALRTNQLLDPPGPRP